MRNASLALVAFLVLAPIGSLGADDVPSFPVPQPEHRWLERFVGQWVTENESVVEPGKPAMKCQGTMNARMLGGFWVITEVENNMMGTKVNAIQTIGYDPQRKKYVGTWVDSMMNHLWQYSGTVDETGRTLTLEAEGPSFLEEGKTGQFRDTYEFKTKDHIVVTSSMRDKEGNWVTFMTGEAQRKNQAAGSGDFN